MPTLAEMNKVADRKRRNAEVMQDIPVWSSKDDDIIDADFYEELESKIAANNDVKPKRRKSSVRRAVSNVVNNVSNINNTFSQKVPKVAPLPSNDDVVEILQQQTALIADQASNTAQIADSVSNVYALFKELNKDKLSPKMQQIGGVQNPAANQVKFDEDALARAIAKALQAQGGSLFDSIASMLGGGGGGAGEKKGKKGGRVRGSGKVGRVLGAVKEAVSNAPSKLFGAAAGGLSAARAGAAKLGGGATSAISDLAEKVRLSPKLQQMGGGRFGKLLGMGASLFRSPVGKMAAAGLGGAAIGYGGGAAVSAMGGGGTATDLSNIRGDSSAVNHAMKLLGKGGQISPEQAKNLKLGSVSEVFESGGRGVSTISTGRGDYGGVSYGNHQLASQNGSMSRFLRSDQGAKFAEHFQGLTPGSAAFNEAYKKLASGENSKAFEDAQHHYIKATHYDPLAAKVAKETGLDVNKRSNALQELVFSTSTQFGGHTGVVSRALKGKDVSKMTDAEIISSIQDNKRDNVNNDFYSSKADVRAGIARRTMNEKDVLLKILAAEEEAKKQEAIAETQKQAAEKEGGVSVADASQMTAKQPTDVSAQTTQATQPVGIYPVASTAGAVTGAAAFGVGAAAIESGVTKGANKVLGRAPAAAAATTAGKIGAKAVPALGAAVSAYDAYTVLKNDQLSREEKERELSGIGGGMAGAAAGAAIGSFVPVVGTIAGGIVGYIVGEQGVKLIYDYAFGTPEEQAQRKLLEGAVPAPSVSADSLTNGPLASSPAGKAYNDAIKLVTDPAAAKEAFGAEKGSENPLMMKPGYTAPASLVAKDSKAANAEVSANIDHAKNIEEAKAAAQKAAAAPKPAEVKPQAPVSSTQAAVKPAETNAQTLKPELQTVTANALAPTMQQTQPGMKQAAGKPTIEKPVAGAKPAAETKPVADSIVPQTQTPTMQNPITATGTTGMPSAIPSAIPSAMAAGAAALGSAVTGLEGISIQQQQLQVQQQQLQALQALAGKGGEMPGKGAQGKDAKAPNEPQVMSGGAPTTAPIGSVGSAPAAPLSQNASSPASPSFYKSEPTMTQQVVAQQAPTQTATVNSTQAAPEPAQRQQYDGVQKVMMIEPKAQAPAPAGSGPAAATPAMPQPSGNGENSKGGAEDKPRIDDVPALVSDFGLIFVNAGML